MSSQDPRIAPAPAWGAPPPRTEQPPAAYPGGLPPVPGAPAPQVPQQQAWYGEQQYGAQQQYGAPPPQYGAPPPQYGAPMPPAPPGPPPAGGTNTMALLGLIFAFVCSPVGLVLSILGLKQTKERNEGGHGLALAGLIISIISIVAGILVLVLALTVWSRAVDLATAGGPVPSATAGPTQDVGSGGGGATSDSPAAGDTGTVPQAGGANPQVAASCQVVLPAVENFVTAIGTATSADEFASQIDQLSATLQSATNGVDDPAYLNDVGNLDRTLQSISDSVQGGQQPSSEDIATLGATTAALFTDCAAAGYSG